MQEVSVLKSILNNFGEFYEFGEPQTYKNLTIIPIISKGALHEPEFILIDDAEEQGLVKVEELPSARVEAVSVTSNANVDVLIPAFVNLKAGLQNRLIFEPFLIPATQEEPITMTVEVRCIEAGRWHPISRGSGELKMKVAKEYTAPRLLRTLALKEKFLPQRSVWSMASAYLVSYDVSSSTADLTAVFERKSDEVDEYVRNFKSVEGQVGAAIFINGEFMALELYGSPRAWERVAEKVARTFALDALRFKKKEKYDVKVPDFGEMDFEIIETKKRGAGDAIRFRSKDGNLYGIALCRRESLYYLFVAPVRTKEKDTLEELASRMARTRPSIL